MKILKKSNPRLVLEIKTHIFGIELSESTIKQDLKDSEEQIRRHVDNIHSIYTEWDTEEYCSYCGYGWEVDEQTKEPLCCQKAIDEFNQSKKLIP